MIEASGLSLSFGPIRAVEGVSFKAEAGEILALLGPNGAGKSTTLRMLTGFLRPDSGTANLAGHDVWENPPKAQEHLGYLPEVAPLYGEMLVKDFLRFVGRVRGLRGRSLRDGLERVSGICELGLVWNQTIETLSKGFRRRVGLAQALIHDPSCLILDEPADGLDPNQKRELREVLREMTANRSILISTHDLSEVEALGARMVILAGGKVVASGSVEELKAEAGAGKSLEDLFAGLTDGGGQTGE
ncbi:MAG: ABC transporter ATP-binding protein [Puniceicoccaceae bacterium]